MINQWHCELRRTFVACIRTVNVEVVSVENAIVTERESSCSLLDWNLDGVI